MPLEKAFGKTERLRPGKKQLLGLPNFLLPLRFSFGHKKISPPKWRPRIVAVQLALSNYTQKVVAVQLAVAFLTASHCSSHNAGLVINHRTTRALQSAAKRSSASAPWLADAGSTVNSPTQIT